jgi:hypothetical protein
MPGIEKILTAATIIPSHNDPQQNDLWFENGESRKEPRR